jgi:hypothetical protein
MDVNSFFIEGVFYLSAYVRKGMQVISVKDKRDSCLFSQDAGIKVMEVETWILLTGIEY